MQELPSTIISPPNCICGNNQVIKWLEELLCQKVKGDDKLESMQAILKVFNLAAKKEKVRMDRDFDDLVVYKKVMEVFNWQNEM